MCIRDRNVRFLMSANADVAECIAKEGSKVTKKPVKELGMPCLLYTSFIGDAMVRCGIGRTHPILQYL